MASQPYFLSMSWILLYETLVEDVIILVL
jgi:hypothetical protein